MADGSPAGALARGGSARCIASDALPDPDIVSSTAIPVPPRMPATISSRLRLRVARRACLPGRRTALPPAQGLPGPRSSADSALTPARTEPRIIAASTLAGLALIDAFAPLGRFACRLSACTQHLKGTARTLQALDQPMKEFCKYCSRRTGYHVRARSPSRLHRLVEPQSGSYRFDDDCLFLFTFEPGKTYGQPGVRWAALSNLAIIYSCNHLLGVATLGLVAGAGPDPRHG